MAWGDPHYVTFDGLRYDFQGDCEYTLVSNCQNSSSLPPFHITAQNMKRRPTDLVSYTQEVIFEYDDMKYLLLGNGEVRIDGRTVTLPVQLNNGVTITSNGVSVVSFSAILMACFSHCISRLKGLVLLRKR